MKTYQRRVELGGWAEETWYAQLQVARCMLKQGNETGFVRNALAAWNSRPHRAEPLYDLARFHRDRGENFPATLFAVQGMRIPWPQDDSLFIEDAVYNWSLKEEYAISGYYVPEHKERAAAVCDALALSLKVPATARNQARRNLRFYAKPLQELLPSFQPERVRFEPAPGWHAMNPCVLRWNNELWLLQRTVNYTVTAAGDYITGGDEPVRTRNFLLRLDRSFAVLHAAELKLPADLPPPSFDRVLSSLFCTPPPANPERQPGARHPRKPLASRYAAPAAPIDSHSRDRWLYRRQRAAPRNGDPERAWQLPDCRAHPLDPRQGAGAITSWRRCGGRRQPAAVRPRPPRRRSPFRGTACGIRCTACGRSGRDATPDGSMGSAGRCG